jgi:hypothetical protein
MSRWAFEKASTGKIMPAGAVLKLTQEINKLLVSRRSVIFSGFLFERFFQNLLQHLRGVVVVEGHVGDHVVLVQLGQLLVDQDRLPAPRVAHQHDRVSLVHQQVQEVFDSDCFCVLR